MRFLIIFLFLFPFLHAENSYDSGKRLYMQKGCYSCHGNNAEGMHTYPRLANRARGFLTYKLERFRNKISDNQQQEMMIPFAVGLSDNDIKDITHYLYEFVEEKHGEKYDDSYKTHGDGGS
ncbi:cytochrome c [bacterium]|nr:cytochrome c [bacterium]MBU1993979.1 cytochrome c [bacterium]